MSQPTEVRELRDPVGDIALDVWSNPSLRKIGEQPKQKLTTRSFKVMAKMLASAVATGLVDGLDATNLAMFVDYSHWNGQIDFAKARPWADGMFTKAADGKQMYKGDYLDLENYKDKTLDYNIQQAYDAGVPCIPYLYMHFQLEPGWTLDTIVDWQYKVLMNALKNKRPGVSFHAIAFDVEETVGGNTNALWIAQHLYDKVKATPGFENIPIIWYTSIRILNLLPALLDWLSYKGSDKILWLAQWVYTSRVKISWEQLYSNYIAKLNMKFITPGFVTWAFGQFAACFELPGCTVNITDLSFFKGDVTKAYTLLHYKQTTPPPVEPEKPPVDPETPVDPTKYATKEELGAVITKQDQLESQLNKLVGWKNTPLE